MDCYSFLEQRHYITKKQYCQAKFFIFGKKLYPNYVLHQKGRGVRRNMEIFKGRHICLLCFFFMLGSFFASQMTLGTLHLAMIGVAIVSVMALVSIFFIKRFRLSLITSFLCLLVVFLSLLHSVLWIFLPQRMVERFVGERSVLCYVVAEKTVSSYSSQYEVRILEVDDEKTDIRGVLICGFQASLDPEDQIRATVSLKETADDSSSRRDGLLMNAYLDDGDGALIQHVEEDRGLIETLFSRSGIRIVSDRIRTTLGNRLERLLGREIGSLSSGFLMGDRSRIYLDVVRDFRRSGTSHQMAVSGLHITVLLGSIELLLRRLYVGKGMRCVAISILSVGFLFLTGFSLSACRSVLMLYAVYVSYLFYDDHDSLTALFASITVILLFSPYSVYDLGMWMSFFATLGVLTVYPLCEANIPFPHKSRRWKRRVLRFGRTVLLAATMTVIANMFLILLTWLFFGELSLVAVPANLLLSPPAYLFLIGTPLVLLFGSVPFFGFLLIAIVQWIGWGILHIVSFFSMLPYATISLDYGFSGIIIIAFSTVFAIFLVIRLPKKRLLLLPPVVAVLSFSVGICLYHGLNSAPRVNYSYSDRGELISVSEGMTASFCDLSRGSTYGYSRLCDELRQTHATEIEALVLTHYHGGHRAMVELCGRNLVLRKLYLPIPQNPVQNDLAREIWEIAGDCGIDVVFYEENMKIQLTSRVRVNAKAEEKEGCPSVFLSIYSKEHALTYLSPDIYGTQYAESAGKRIARSDVVLFGSHGIDLQSRFCFDLSESTSRRQIVYTSKEVYQSSACPTGDAFVYVPPTDAPYRMTFYFHK